jgi:hypothetical protein
VRCNTNYRTRIYFRLRHKMSVPPHPRSRVLTNKILNLIDYLMNMAVLLDLSTELLLKIIAYLPITDLRGPCQVYALSLTSKRLNACCSYWIFKKYCLTLRSRAWNVDVVRARLVRFMAKAGYVKELVLQDWRIDNEGEPGVFPELILPELIDALKCAHAVTSIEVSANYNATLPLPLWEWITTKDLAEFKIGDLLAPPPGAMIHPSVAHFKGGLYECSLPFLEVLTPSSSFSLLLWLIHIYSILSQLMCPKSIKLVYPIWYKDPPPMATYRPISNSNADSDANSPSPYSNLCKITIEIYRLPEHFPHPTFDFSGVPQAAIYVNIYLGVEYKMHVPVSPISSPFLKRIVYSLSTQRRENILTCPYKRKLGNP